MAKYTNYLMLLPGLILCIFFLIIPLGIILRISLSESVSTAEFEIHGLTLEKYVKYFTSPQALSILLNTFGTALLTCLICFVAAYPFAYFLTFHIENEKLKSYVISLLMVPFLIDWNIRTIAWIPILGDKGILNSVLMSLGVIEKPLSLLFGRIGLYIIWLQTYVLFMMFPIYLALNRIDPDLIQAARVLKAPPHRVFYDIIFKLSLPGVICGWIFVFVSTLGDYITPGLWGGGLQTLGLSISTFFAHNVWPYACGLSTIMVVIALASLYILLKIVDIKKLVYER
ncbi:MAG: ABC transporter permease [Candidatus Bathyarchaeia archaeon]